MTDPEIGFHDDAAHSWRHDNLARLFLDAYRHFEGEIETRVHGVGYDEIRSIHLGVMREMDMDGTRITILAKRLGVTKQAMSQLVKECERIGYVKTQADPSDGRAKIVVFTKKGATFVERSRAIIQAIETDIIKTLGKKRTQELRASLCKIRDSIVKKH